MKLNQIGTKQQQQKIKSQSTHIYLDRLKFSIRKLCDYFSYAILLQKSNGYT